LTTELIITFIVAPCATALLGVNAFFVKQLVNSINNVERNCALLVQKSDYEKKRVDRIEKKIDSIDCFNCEVKDKFYDSHSKFDHVSNTCKHLQSRIDKMEAKA